MRINIASKKIEDNTILSNVSLYISQGERIMISGPSGCGKSLLLSLIRGDKKFQGNIEFDLGEQLRYIPQGLALNTQIPMFKSVRNAAWRNNMSFWEAQKEAENYLSLFSMDNPDQYRTKIENLSGGQQRRVMCAQKLCGHAQYTTILADELDSGLDSNTATVIFQNLARASRKYNHTLIAISHNNEEDIWASFTRLILLGRSEEAGYTVAYDGSPDDVAEHFCGISCRESSKLLGLLKLPPSLRNERMHEILKNGMNENELFAAYFDEPVIRSA